MEIKHSRSDIVRLDELLDAFLKLQKKRASVIDMQQHSSELEV
jgi:hypothetical protein